MQLWIGNKNYSSWSMRAGVLLAQAGIPCEEVKLRLDFAAGSAFKNTLATIAPTGRVPVLVDEGLAVWDTLAIAEYLHDKFPDRGLWPSNARTRARARSVTAEMHSGFGALRSHCPMNIEASLPEIGARLLREVPGVAADLARIDTLWCDALAASGGPLLFGTFSIADAFFAPVVMRVRSYGLPLSPVAQAYADRVVALPGVAAWIADALREHDFIPDDEPYRSAPAPH